MISDEQRRHARRWAHRTGSADPGQMFSFHIAIKEGAEETADLRALRYAAFLTEMFCANLPDVLLYMYAQKLDACLSCYLASAALQPAEII